MTKLGDRLLKITQEAEAREERKKQEWTKARELIREVFSEVTLEGSESKEKNGNSNSLSYRLHDTVFLLLFRYDQSRHVVSRHDYGIGQSKEYDLEEITRASVEGEIEEFVEYVHSRMNS